MSNPDLTLRLNKVIQEIPNHDHRKVVMDARDAVLNLRSQIADPGLITLRRDRYMELLDIEQRFERLVATVKHSQHLRH